MVGPHRLPCETPEAYEPRLTPAVDPAAGDEPTRWVLPATILGSSLAFVDGSVVNVALPAIQDSLEAGLGTVQWVVNGYMLMLASLILLGGSAGDRFGRRRIFLVGLSGFAAASVACGLAPSAAWLILARLAQGATAALLVPASLAIIGAEFEGERRGPAIGTWAAAGALTTAAGPVLGGWLVDTVGWRSVFFINPPIAAAAVVLALKLQDDRNDAERGPLDGLGAVLAVLGLGLLSYGLIALGEGSPLRGAGATIAAIPTLVLFVRAERRARAPMMPLSLFDDRTFSGANLLTVLLYAALSGALFLLPFLLIRVHGYSATAAGAAFLPFSVIMGIGSRWSGGLVDRMGGRLPLVVGPTVSAAGYAILAVSGSDPSYWSGVLPGLLLLSVGMTVSVAPLTTVVLDAAPQRRSGTASGINNAASRAGSLVAVAALGLAFGGTASGAIPVSAVAEAYSVVMLSAAALAAVSGLVAGLTLEGRRSTSRTD